MGTKRKTSGHKIPDIYLCKDEDGTTSGQIISTVAGTTALALSGSDADLVLSGTMAQIIMSGGAGTFNMSGATPAIVGAIQHRNTKAGTVAISLSGSDADIELSGTNAQLILSGNASKITMSGTSAVLDMTGVTPSIAGAIQLTTTKAGTVAVDISGSDADLQISGTNSQLILSGNASKITMSGTSAVLDMTGVTPSIAGAIQFTTTKAGTVAVDISGSDADLQLSGTNAQIIMSGNANKLTMSGTSAVIDMPGVTPSITGAIQMITTKAGTTAIAASGSNAAMEITGTAARFYFANDAGIVGTISCSGNSVSIAIGGSAGTFV